MNQLHQNQPLPSPNPFAFPPETHGRFLMLMLSAIVLTWQISFVLGLQLVYPNLQAQLLEVQTPINNLLGEERDVFALTNSELSTLAQTALPLHPEVWNITFLPLMIPTIGTSILLLVSFILYRTHPYRERPVHRIQTITADTDEGKSIWSVIHEYATAAGILPTPIIEHIANDADSIAPRAFGGRVQNTLLIEGKNIKQLSQMFRHRTNETLFSLIWHELGHIANRDTWRTYAAKSIWEAFSGVMLLIVVVVGFFLLIRASITPSNLLIVVGNLLTLPWLRFLILQLFMWGIWRGLIRNREFYADVWAAQQPYETDFDVRETLTEYFANKIQEKPQERPLEVPFWRKYIDKLNIWWHSVWTAHPTPSERVRILQEPLGLFHLSNDLPFLTGYLLSLLVVGLPFMFMGIIGPLTIVTDWIFWKSVLFISEFTQPWSRFYFLILIFFKITLPAIVVLTSLGVIGYLITHTLGIQVQRQDIGNLLRFKNPSSTGYAQLIQPAFLLTLGVLLGLFSTPPGFSVPWAWTSLLLGVGWLAGFTFMTWLWLVILRLLTRVLIGTHGGIHPPKGAMRFINIIGAFLLAVLFIPALFGLITVPASGLFENAAEMFFMLSFTLIVCLGIAFAVYFLVALCLILPLLLLRLALTKEYCPTCKTQSSYKIVVGQVCTYCHHVLAPWAYAQDSKIKPL